MKTYYAITIGPIVRTLSGARKTRELWAASYVFSWLMKQAARALRKDAERQFILPFSDPQDETTAYLNYEMRGESLEGAGLFPDRIIFQCERDGELDRIREIFDTCIAALANDIEAIVSGGTAQEVALHSEHLRSYLREYLNLHIIRKSLTLSQNPVHELSPILDALEQRQSFPSRYERFLSDYFDQASLATFPHASVLAEDAFGQRRSLEHKTMEHIAVAQFFDRNNKRHTEAATYSGKLIELFEALPDFIQAHKYVAIVQADGDNLGKAISSLPVEDAQGQFSNAPFQDFNHQLMRFAISAVGAINAYGGLPVYAGGDDLLFFAPVINRKAPQTQNIFALLDALDAVFQEHMEKTGLFGGKRTLPTLSFGLSIAFYKFPLYESLDRARYLLFDVAKKVDNARKHKIAFEIRKHSGAKFGGYLPLGREALAATYRQLLASLFEGDNDELLTSVSHKLRQERHLLDLFGADKFRVEAYVRNSFNERIHRQEGPGAFLRGIEALIPAVYKQYPVREDLPEGDPMHPHQQLFGIIRSLQFLTDSTTA